MVTDVIILDVFNTLGMPTSTTVSLVFELLGGAFVIATIKVLSNDTLGYGMLLNSDKALSVIVAIFVSVAIAFIFGVIVMWLSRLIFTFNYKSRSQILTVIFGGMNLAMALTATLMKDGVDTDMLKDSLINEAKDAVKEFVMTPANDDEEDDI